MTRSADAKITEDNFSGPVVRKGNPTNTVFSMSEKAIKAVTREIFQWRIQGKSK